MDVVNIGQAKAHFSHLVKRAAAGEEIIIAKNGKPMAKLSALGRSLEPRPMGRMKGQIWMADDLTRPRSGSSGCSKARRTTGNPEKDPNSA